MDKAKKEKKRHIRFIIQFAFTAVTNGYLLGFLQGKIYTGKLKGLCVPGLSCYSCPGALGSCPIGALQSVLNSNKYHFSYYVTGFLILVGSLIGRLVCGFLCPFGWVQDLLYRIPFIQKRKTLPGDRYLKYLKYFVLLFFVFLLPALITGIGGQGEPWFCKYICPSGTLMAGLPLLAANEGLRDSIGFLFSWKAFVLLLILLVSIWSYRPFCRYLCPLGAFYGFFNRISLFRYQIDTDRCTSCGLCQKTCPFGIDPSKTPNSSECIRCGECIHSCPHHALRTSTMRKIKTEKENLTKI